MERLGKAFLIGGADPGRRGVGISRKGHGMEWTSHNHKGPAALGLAVPLIWCLSPYFGYPLGEEVVL